jgi:hypothetical protein
VLHNLCLKNFPALFQLIFKLTSAEKFLKSQSKIVQNIGLIMNRLYENKKELTPLTKQMAANNSSTSAFVRRLLWI